MKTLITSLLVILLVAAVGYAQVQPNGPPQGTTTQGVTSLMSGGAHDFTPTGAFGQSLGQPQDLCGYCHRPHTLAAGMVGSEGGTPLWARASIVGRSATYGVYTSGSMDATVVPVNNDDNYSSFCLSCHDGSTFLAASEYGPTGKPYGTWPAAFTTLNIDSAYAFTDGGFEPNAQQSLSHLHPVHFNYAAAQAKDGQLFPAATTEYVWLNTTTTPATATGRLFNGDMECSSCHNPHFKNGIGLQGAGSTNNGALCVACHMK
jgi:predicted CXXCH cytochrome family protein